MLFNKEKSYGLSVTWRAECFVCFINFHFIKMILQRHHTKQRSMLW